MKPRETIFLIYQSKVVEQKRKNGTVKFHFLTNAQIFQIIFAFFPMNCIEDRVAMFRGNGLNSNYYRRVKRLHQNYFCHYKLIENEPDPQITITSIGRGGEVESYTMGGFDRSTPELTSQPVPRQRFGQRAAL